MLEYFIYSSCRFDIRRGGPWTDAIKRGGFKTSNRIKKRGEPKDRNCFLQEIFGLKKQTIPLACLRLESGLKRLNRREEVATDRTDVNDSFLFNFFEELRDLPKFFEGLK